MFLHSSPSNDFQVLFSFLKDPFLRFYIMKVLLCSELSTVPDNFSCPKSQTNCLCQPSALLLCASLLNRVWLFVTPWTITTRLLSLQDFPGKNTGMDCHFLLWDLPDPGINRTPVSCVVCIAGGLSLLSHQWSPALFLALPFPPFSSLSILNFCSLISGCRMHVFLYLFCKTDTENLRNLSLGVDLTVVQRLTFKVNSNMISFIMSISFDRPLVFVKD